MIRSIIRNFVIGCVVGWIGFHPQPVFKDQVTQVIIGDLIVIIALLTTDKEEK